MFLFKILHALNESLNAFHRHSVVAACAEATYRTVTLDADHTTLCSVCLLYTSDAADE